MSANQDQLGIDSIGSTRPLQLGLGVF